MDEKPNPAAGNPAPATDPAPEESSSQATTAAAEQGVSAAASTTSVNDSQAPDTSSSGQDETPGASDSTDSTPHVGPHVGADAEATPSTPADEGTATPADEGTEATTAEEPVMTFEAMSEAMANETASTDDADSEVELTMEDVLAASDEQLARKPIHRGMIANGEVIMLAQDGIIIDVGAKIEGLLPYNQLFEFEANAEEAAKYFKPGDEIQVYVVRADIPNNTIVLSKKRADQERAWNLLQEIHDRQKPVEVEIIEKVRGGLVANLGIRAFLPASQVDVRRVNDLTPYVGERLKVMIIELNRKRNRVIISRRAILEVEIAGLKAETLKRLEPGLRLEGEVVEITDFGAFVNLGGIDGLVHRSELTHGRFNHPRDVVKLSQKVKVEVLDMDLERERINLSMKNLVPNPWENVLANYSIGQRIGGTVTNLTPFGAFVEIEPGLEGLIHVSEMSWTKRIRHPKEVLTEGEEVEAMILKIDTNQQRISLGLRQTQPDPWSSLPDRYPPGTEVTGPITGITDFGVFMEIEEGIEGLVHISELSHDHIDDISEHFGKGDEISAVILNIDPVEQRASLSRKRLMPYTASEFGTGESMGGGLGAPAARTGARKGRRGGRRSQGIDYDYSYAATDAGGKTTTKLGDVYADLFAQFGLSEGQADEGDEGDEDTVTAEADEAQVADEQIGEDRPEATDEVEAEAETDEADEATDEAATDVEAEAESRPEAAGAPAVGAAETEADTATEAPVETANAEAGDEDTENAIDAAEAAALLTAAFREGKRPPRPEADAGSADAKAEEQATEEEAEPSEA